LEVLLKMSASLPRRLRASWYGSWVAPSAVRNCTRTLNRGSALRRSQESDFVAFVSSVVKSGPWRAWRRTVWLGMFACLLGAPAFSGRAAETVRIEAPPFRWEISGEGRNLAFVDRASGKDWLRLGGNGPMARVRVAGKEHPVDHVSLAEGRLELGFSAGAARATLKIETRSFGVLVSVEKVEGDGVEALTFVQIPLSTTGKPADAFGACAHALNLRTRVDALPVLQTDLIASCEKAYGMVGAKVGLVAGPMDRILAAMRDLLADASELPVCRVAGPWARDVPSWRPTCRSGST
jgi:hypothetical protein